MVSLQRRGFPARSAGGHVDEPAGVHPVLDLARDNPAGRLPVTDLLAAATTGSLGREGGRTVLDVGPRRWSLDDPLPDEAREALRSVLALDVSPGVGAAALATLAATGAVLVAPELDGATASALGPLLAAELCTPAPGPHDRRGWEQRSVRQRREAMRRWGGASLFPGGSPTPVSALLVTRRPALVDAALAALEASTYPTVEVVLVVHGPDEVPAPVAARAAASPLRVVVHAEPAGSPFGGALAAAAQRASGPLLTKVDDDDRYGPEHVWDLVLAHASSGADLVGKPLSLVRVERLGRTVWRAGHATEVDTTFVAGGTMLLTADRLREAGGWAPLPRHVDRALLDAVLEPGGRVYRTHGEGFVYVRHDEADHTWAADPALFLADSVEQWLDADDDLTGS
jgi:hypothetical protein